MADDKDKILETALKAAKTKEFTFAYIGPEKNGKLILAKTPGSRVPKNDIEAAKKEVKNNTVVIGKCIGPLDDMVFKVLKPTRALADGIKKAVHNQTTLTVKKVDIQKLIAQAGEDIGDGEENAGQLPPPAAAAPAQPEPAAPAHEAKFDLPTYQAAWEKVRNGLRELAKKFFDTKHTKVRGAIDEINFIISNTKLLANPAPNKIQEVHDFIVKDETITAMERVPDHYHDLDIREPLLKAWKR